MKYLNLFLALLLLVSSSFALTNITSIPFTISSPDTYVLTGDLTNGTPTAITIQSDNVTLDCQGFSITGLYTNSTQGIFLSNSNNVTIENCIVREYGVNFFSSGGNNTIVRNNTFDNASQTGVQACVSFSCFNWTVNNNTISNSFNNGWEHFRCDDNCLFENNTIWGQVLGHGTDRGFQYVANITNSIFRNNSIFNNTFCLRSDNNNMSNVSIVYNHCFDNIQGLNMQASVGTFQNFTFSHNIVTTTPNGSGFDITWPAISTKATDCSAINAENNTVTGGPYLWFNKTNGENQTIANQVIGGMGVCDADNIIIENITFIGGGTGQNAMEFMQVNNATVRNITITNPRVGLRLLTVNDSLFSVGNIFGSIIGAINGNGGGSNRNIIENFTITNITQGSGVSIGGSNNTIRNMNLGNSTTVSSMIGFGAATTTSNISYSNINIMNTPLGILLTVISSTVPSSVTDVYIENVTQPILVNSTSVGSKTYAAYNTTIAFSGGVNRTSFDLADIVVPSQSYLIKNQTNGLGVPAGVNQSFLGKGINISIFNTTTVFSQLNFSWLDSEVGLLNESSISLYSNNGSGWVLVNDTPDLTNNKIRFNGSLLEGSSTLLALFANVSNCVNIVTPGQYVQTQNYSGTAFTNAFGTSTCVLINSSDVEFDCNNFAINGVANNGAGVSISPGNTNVTLMNCDINGYFYGVMGGSNSNNSIRNNTIHNISASGVYLDTTSTYNISSNMFNNNGQGIDLVFGDVATIISNNSFSSHSLRAISLSSSNQNFITNNGFDLNNIDISTIQSGFNLISSNAFTNSGFISVQLSSGGLGNFIQNNTFSNFGTAIYSGPFAQSNQITNNTFTNAIVGQGITIDTSDLNVIANNTITGTSAPITLVSPTNTLVTQNNITAFATVGVDIVSLAENNNITFNRISGGNNGIRYDADFPNIVSNNIVNASFTSGISYSGTNGTISNNIVNLSTRGFQVINGTTLLLTNNTAFANVQVGFGIQGLVGGTLSLNNATLNGEAGFAYLDTISGVTITNESASQNSESGFSVRAADVTISNSVSNFNSGGGFASGFEAADVGNITFINVSATGNEAAGFVAHDSAGPVTIINSTSFSNNPGAVDPGVGAIPGGVIAFNISGLTLSNNTFRNEPTGILVVDSSVSTLTNHLYANGNDTIVANAGGTGNLVFVRDVYDNPAGDFVNATTLSLNDVIGAGETYLISYTTNNDPSSTGNESVENATVRIETGTTMSINSLIWTYNPGSLNATIENSIRVWTFDGTNWIRQNSSVNIGLNTATLNLVNSSANYTLLFDPNTTAPSVFVTSLTYYNQTAYSNYNTSGSTITTGDTGYFLISFFSNGAPSNIGLPIEIIAMMIPLIAIALLGYLAYRYMFRNNGNI